MHNSDSVILTLCVGNYILSYDKYMSLTDGNNQNQNDYVEKRLKTILENDSMDELVIDSVIIMLKISQ